jgi:cell division protein FtsN
MRGIRALVTLGLVVGAAGVAGAPAPAAAQSLDQVDALTREGAVAEARDELLAWWEGPGPSAGRDDQQRALWLRGLLTLDPAQAALDYTRLAVEYPSGPFTDRALLRLAGMARARGDAAAARRHYRTLARDYPNSPARTEARAWLDANPEEPAATDPPRASEPARSAPPSTTTAATSAPAARAPAATAQPFAVQFGAFGERARADDLAGRLGKAGFEPRIVVVEGSDLVRVRMGRFADPADATRLFDRVRAAGFDAMVVTDVARERPAGGG